MFTGCGGCSPDPAAQAKKKEEARKKAAEELKKKKQKEPFQFGQLAVQPFDKTQRLALKPGHWAATTQQMKANLDNFVGTVELAVVDESGRPIELDRTSYQMLSRRPVALTKGRGKEIETTIFTPTVGKVGEVRSKLRQRGGTVNKESRAKSSGMMLPFQYHFVVLAQNAARYTYVKTLDVVLFPNGGAEGTDFDNDEHYRVVLPNVGKRTPLPDNPLLWTTIACILWDGIEPDRLALDERQALIDWLHWGGQLIISGPDSLDRLRGSFLDKYLAAEGDGATEIEQAKLDTLTHAWTPQKSRPRIPPLVATDPWSGIKLKTRDGASEVPGTGGLLVERRVGRGRIVVSGFQLDEQDFVNWKAIGGFYNACLLRRPPREWKSGQYDASLNWAEIPERRLDARLVTKVQYFARDAGVQSNYARQKVVDETGGQWGRGRGGRIGRFNSAPEEEYQWIAPDARGGVAAWNDFSQSAKVARETLRQAAGVTVPKSSLVLMILAVYLIVLVPLNWLFFHALGRVEWAWIAAPIIAVAGTILVVWQAQLDIGFVRAQTDVAIIETQGDHPRAHLTRYTAVYTSLGATYDFLFEDPSALAQPFPVDYKLIEGQTRETVVFQKHQDVRLTGLSVSSNFTSMLHSEQMLDMEKAIRLSTSSTGQPQIVNGSAWNLFDVAVIKRPAASDGLKGCWIGRLPASTSVAVSFPTLPKEVPFNRDRQSAARSSKPSTFPLEDLMRLALDVNQLEPGEVRLVGRMDGVLPGIDIQPAASQVRGAALVVAHLDYGALPEPKPDVNSRPAPNQFDLEE